MTTATPTPAAAPLDIPRYCRALAEAALAASRRLMVAGGAQRRAALLRIADELVAAAPAIEQANALDLADGRAAGLSDAMLDRLQLDTRRIGAMAESVRQIARQDDPVGQVIEGRVLPSGLRLEKVRVPIGVVFFIYESRPNVTSDAAALCLKSGNALILRGGKEAFRSNTAVAACIARALGAAGLPADAVQSVATTDRAAVGELLRLDGLIDLAVPRGGESLIRAVVEQSRIPVIKHYTGNCHVYVDATADVGMARAICLNAKVQRPGVCNAAESLVFHRTAADKGILRYVCEALGEKGVEIRGDEHTRRLFPDARPATEQDWATEYLGLVISVKVVDSLDEAVDHINRYGSKHTDAIVTAELAAADAFVQRIDSANVFVNCSTRLSDGGEYGLGAEIGISTDKLHARGPMGAADLTTYKWVARGSGQVRA